MFGGGHARNNPLGIGSGTTRRPRTARVGRSLRPRRPTPHTNAPRAGAPQALVADGIAPGLQLGKMMADILAEGTGLTALDLSKNNMARALLLGGRWWEGPPLPARPMSP